MYIVQKIFCGDVVLERQFRSQVTANHFKHYMANEIAENTQDSELLEMGAIELRVKKL